MTNTANTATTDYQTLWIKRASRIQHRIADHYLCNPADWRIASYHPTVAAAQNAAAQYNCPTQILPGNARPVD
jgi:hypothetical protein